MTQYDSRACQTAIATRECNRGFPLVYTLKLVMYVLPACPQLISFISSLATNKEHELLYINQKHVSVYIHKTIIDDKVQIFQLLLMKKTKKSAAGSELFNSIFPLGSGTVSTWAMSPANANKRSEIFLTGP